MNPLERIFNLLAPNDCINCHTEGSVLCQECFEKIERVPAICYSCGKLSRNFRPCPKCINHWRPQHVWIYTFYEGLAAELVKNLKFGQKRSAAKIIAELIDEVLPYFADKPLVTYVPTAPSRRRERGFDQAELIAKELAKLRKWHVITLLKRQAKVRQLGSKRDIRRVQLKNAFRAVNIKLLANNHILLIDDVVTTGATIEACTKTLLKAGANSVNVVAFAYTPKKGVRS